MNSTHLVTHGSVTNRPTFVETQSYFFISFGLSTINAVQVICVVGQLFLKFWRKQDPFDPREYY